MTKIRFTHDGHVLETDLRYADDGFDGPTVDERGAFEVIEWWESIAPNGTTRSSYDITDDGIIVLAQSDADGIEMVAWFIGDTDWPLDNFPFTGLTWEVSE